ncbi:hypothetical protein ACFOLD_16260 [Kocuria carniphila]|uniref:hypothetical protein n=1 Tax=Kocuria carniphila TaxID=262208 RepID=UPI003608A690
MSERTIRAIGNRTYMWGHLAKRPGMPGWRKAVRHVHLQFTSATRHSVEPPLRQ